MSLINLRLSASKTIDIYKVLSVYNQKSVASAFFGHSACSTWKTHKAIRSFFTSLFIAILYVCLQAGLPAPL